MTILYIEDNDARSVLDFTRENLIDIRNRTNSLFETINGLIGADLAYDSRSPLMMLELLSGLVEKTEGARNRLVVDLLHMENGPSTRSIVNAAKISSTKVKALNANAEPLPEEDERRSER